MTFKKSGLPSNPEPSPSPNPDPPAYITTEGMQRPILRQLQLKGGLKAGGVGLVVGAGGTARAACYAVRDMGLRLVVVNRSVEKGKEIADRFGGVFVPDLSEESLSWLSTELQLPDFASHIDVIISTVPLQANFTVPPALLKEKPVVLDVVYKPAKTPLIQQVQLFVLDF